MTGKQCPKPPPQDMMGRYEYHCGGCVTSFFGEAGHRQIQRDGAWCERCSGELILVWPPVGRADTDIED
jgi:hypothetical protein